LSGTVSPSGSVKSGGYIPRRSALGIYPPLFTSPSGDSYIPLFNCKLIDCLSFMERKDCFTFSGGDAFVLITSLHSSNHTD